MSGWKGSNRRKELPANWEQLRAEARRRAGGRCEHVSKSGVRCSQPGTDADHRSNRWDHSDLQWLCREHHNRKTAQESSRARSRQRGRGRRRRRDDRPGRL